MSEADRTIPEAVINSFCVAPWVHAHVTPTGQRALCCQAPLPDEESARGFQDLAAFRNSDRMKSIRQQMLEGILPENCNGCRSAFQPETLRAFLNRRFAWAIPQIFGSTKADGTTSFEPVYFDYRPQGCNLACKTCGPYSSTKYAQNIKSHPIGREIIDLGPRDDSGILAANRYKSEVVPELLREIEKGKVTDMNFAGGEPLLDPHHAKILRACIERGNASAMTLTYNTNFTLRQSLLEQFLKDWGAFGKVHLSISLDGVGEIGEWIRTGLVFTDFLENLRTLKRLRPPNLSYSLDLTLTSLGLLDLRRYCDFAVTEHLWIWPRLMLGSEHAAFMRTEFLPRAVRRRIADDWLNYWMDLPSSQQEPLQALKPVLETVAEREEFAPGSFDFRKQMDNFKILYADQPHFLELLARSPFTAGWSPTSVLFNQVP